MSNARAAVAMTVYKNDSVDYLVKALDSLCDQSFKNLSIFIGVDGPVTKAIDDVLCSYGKSYENVSVIRFMENRGLASSLNQVIDFIIENDHFDYVLRMDSDDISFSNRVERQIQYMEDNPEISVCGTFCEEFGAGFALKRKVVPENHKDLVEFSVARCPFIHPTVMFRSKIFMDGVRYPTNSPFTEDQALWFDLIDKGYQLGNLNEVLLMYRLDNQTVKRRLGLNKLSQELRLRLKYMVKLNQISAKNVILVLGRVVFHLFPAKIAEVSYRYLR